MIWSFSLRQLVIATALIFIFGTVNLHAEQKSDIEAVTAANLDFDTALSARDINAMERVWAAEPYVIAVHPASKVLIVGLDAVRKSWEGTFDRFAEISVSMKEPQIHVAQKVAWVVGMEECAREVQQRGCRELHGLRKKGWALLMVLHTTSRVPQ